MKRGLFEWDKKKVSSEEFQQRLERVRTALGQAGLDFLLVYADVDQGGAARYLTNFAPYWNNALIVLPKEGDPILATGLSRRVHGWIGDVSILRDIRSGSDLVKLAQEAITSFYVVPTKVGTKDESTASSGSVGLAEADSFPAALRQKLEKGLPSFLFSEATPVLREARRIPSPAELSLMAEGAKLATRAIEEGARKGWAGAVDLAAQVERLARLAGAEDVSALVGGKLGHWYPATQLGEHPAEGMLLSTQYMGYWTRVGRPLSNGRVGQFEPAAGCASLIRPGLAPGRLREEMAKSMGLGAPDLIALEHMAGAFPFEPFNAQEEERPLVPGMVICVTTAGSPFWAYTFLVTEKGGQVISNLATGC